MDMQTVVPMPPTLHEIFQALQKAAQQAREGFVQAFNQFSIHALPNLDELLTLTMPQQRPWWCRPRYHYLKRSLPKSQIYTVKDKQVMAAKFRKGESQK